MNGEKIAQGWRVVLGKGKELLAPLRGFADSVIDLVMPRSCPACGRVEEEVTRPTDAIVTGELPAPAEPSRLPFSSVRSTDTQAFRAVEFCELCQLHLADNLTRCSCCGEALPAAAFDEPGSPQKRLSQSERREYAQVCMACRLDPHSFRRVYAVGPYEAELRQLVLRSKQAAGYSLCQALACLAVNRHADALRAAQFTAVTPIPSHWTRRLVRGYDSVGSMAACVARCLGIPKREYLYRRRPTRLQSGLSRTSRSRNVRGAFRLRYPQFAQNAHVLLVDDIMTSGATCEEAAKQLVKAGATCQVLVICRAQN